MIAGRKLIVLFFAAICVLFLFVALGDIEIFAFCNNTTSSSKEKRADADDVYAPSPSPPPCEAHSNLNYTTSDISKMVGTALQHVVLDLATSFRGASHQMKCFTASSGYYGSTSGCAIDFVPDGCGRVGKPVCYLAELTAETLHLGEKLMLLRWVLPLASIRCPIRRC